MNKKLITQRFQQCLWTSPDGSLHRFGSEWLFSILFYIRSVPPVLPLYHPFSQGFDFLKKNKHTKRSTRYLSKVKFFQCRNMSILRDNSILTSVGYFSCPWKTLNIRIEILAKKKLIRYVYFFVFDIKQFKFLYINYILFTIFILSIMSVYIKW